MRNPLAVIPQRLRRQVASPLSTFGSLNPFRAIADLESEMDRWMQNSLAMPEVVSGYDFAPACDFAETSKEYVVRFDIPGIKKDDVKIEIENNRLTVSGERTDKIEEKDARSFLSETCCGAFMRSFTLPTSVDETKVDAHYENGVLTVKIPKAHLSKAREVKIQ